MSEHHQDADLYDKAHAEAFESDSGGPTILAYRGTQTGADWGTNFHQAIFGGGDQYNAAIAVAQGIKQEFHDNALLTGHSLGGGEASAGALVTGLHAVTFNAAGLNSRTIAPYGVSTANGSVLIKSYYIRGEMLSVMQSFLPIPSAAGTLIPLNPTPQDAQRGSLGLHAMDNMLDSLGVN